MNTLLILLCIPTLALAVTDCSGDPSLGCFEDADCAPATTTGKCTGGVLTPLTLGCCGTLATTTTSAATTTVASGSSGTGTVSGSSTTCVDKVNPVTGTSDCGPKSFLCTDANYRQVMIDQCPRTCGFCSTSSASSSSSSSSTGTLFQTRLGVLIKYRAFEMLSKLNVL
ncbi:hypothetical protein PRIPAC_97215, partial [Pristionchus pacificus]|uniref:ShK domain-containing protein n=1 Tax=Pristionchus pacificus TaxID=54126 RepID=A0A2A6B2G0_PRIPA